MGNETKGIAFQGEHGAYSEQAVYAYFGRKATPRPFRVLRDVFDAVEKNKVSHGVVPVENSLEGSVSEAYDFLLRSTAKVGGEINLRIDHCLIVYPGVSISRVKKVYSHPQALSQCRKFLEKMGCEVYPFYDTAGSVKMIKNRRMREAAAIASDVAAEVYGMHVLARSIQDKSDNYTRFLVVSTSDSFPTTGDKTSIVFSLAHKPGTLYQALEPFANRKINLAKIESRPTREKPWEYNFFLDFEGHISEQRCKEALSELSLNAKFVKILGSYPKASYP